MLFELGTSWYFNRSRGSQTTLIEILFQRLPYVFCENILKY